MDSKQSSQSFSNMPREELLEFCRSLYLREGLNALKYCLLKQYKGLYWNLYNNGLSQKKLLSALGIEKEYKAARKSWPWERCIKEAEKIREHHSFLPPAAWFQNNGYASLVNAVYQNGKTWEALREALGDFIELYIFHDTKTTLLASNTPR